MSKHNHKESQAKLGFHRLILKNAKKVTKLLIGKNFT